MDDKQESKLSGQRTVSGGIPEFLVEEEEFPCGYAPRAMELSLRSDALFVGCKDGTITIVKNLAGENNQEAIESLQVFCSDSLADQAAGQDRPALTVRAMCEWCDGWLLIGRDDGRIDLLSWKEVNDKENIKPTCLWEGEERSLDSPANRVTYMDWLDETRLLLSFRNSGTWIVNYVEGEEVPTVAREAFQEALRGSPLPGVTKITGICCTASIEDEDGNREWILSSQSGVVWLAKDHLEGFKPGDPIEEVWPEGEMPGFITDFALIKQVDETAKNDEGNFDIRGQTSKGVYLATDNGVYLLALTSEGLLARRISLPGVGRMCMAVTYYADEKGAFLWVSDSAGDAHLFWDQPKAPEPNWRRSGVRHDVSQVMLGYASWRTLNGRFVVGQARRNDYVVISRYKAQLPEEAQDLVFDDVRVLLRHGTVKHLRQRLLENEPLKEEWPPDALLAELFEELGEKTENLKILREFLGNPNAELACNILRELPTEDPERYGRAIELWTYALLGTVHRHSEYDGESLYLGIVRWLRTIAQKFPQGTVPAEYVQQSVERQIIFSRKWGVFGNSYARRRSALKPLQVLTAQQPHVRGLDHFAYRSLLFARQVDLEYEDDRGRPAGRTAWDMQALRVGDRLFLAVSWIWGGIELYEAVPPNRATGEGYRLKVWAVLEPTLVDQEFKLLARNVDDIPSSERRVPDYGYSRSIVLGVCPEGKYYLLAAPTQRPEPQTPHSLELWCLDLSGKKARVLQEGESRVRCPLRFQGEGNESVYSLLEVEPGLVLAGLRGHGGIAQVTLIVVNGDGTEMHCVTPKERLASADPEGKAIARNRVWSFAKDVVTGEGMHDVFAGCDDGRVWRLKIPLRNAEIGDEFEMSPTLVERLGAPVWALACQTTEENNTSAQRVFAGGADGTIVAWQQFFDPQTNELRITTVWATWEEGGPISRIQCLPGSGMVLALTQQGRGILFANGNALEDTSSDKRHRRLRVPGERYGRFELRAAVFASELLESHSELPSGALGGAFARLATATNDGRLQIHTLHYPLYQPERGKEYKELVKMWLEIVCEAGDEKSFGPFQLQRLRMVEAGYAASTTVPQVLVRGILERDNSKHWEAAPKFKRTDRHWMPRHLRPLLDLDLAWGWEGKLDASTAGKSLELALERVFLMHDISLFGEIVTVVLNRANRWLFDVAGRQEEKNTSLEAEKEFYGAILDALDRSLQHWLGSSERAEIRVRISFAKQLSDGDTLWRLCHHIESSKDNETIPEKRIGTIRKLLVLGDPLLALETLRATNFSLMRLCKRLVEDGNRAGGWAPGPPRKGLPRQEAPWKGLKTYVEALSDYAARASHSSEGISEALAHEITRSFALTVCACPSAAIRVAHWMSEAGLITRDDSRRDRARNVLDQFLLLEFLGVPVPKDAIELFKRAASGRQEDHDISDEFWNDLLQLYNRSLGPSKRLELIEERVGVDNGDVIRQVAPYHVLLQWLITLSRQLSGDASGINLSRVKGILGNLERRDERPPGENRTTEDPFRHSRKFWIERLRDLKLTCAQKYELEPSDRVQPEIVLLSREIDLWCLRSIKELKNSTDAHELFEPQHSIYRRALSQLQRAAAEFPFSTAIQKNIVVGVLGHGLLESLDEHVLELEEIAQALDPLLVWKYRDDGRSLPESSSKEDGRSFSRSEFFTTYLLRRSEDAESIPKNLRTLQGLLNPGRQSGANGGKLTMSFRQDLLRDFSVERSDGESKPRARDPGWILSEHNAGDIELKGLELRFLRLTLKELDQNDRNYGPRYSGREEGHWPCVDIPSGDEVTRSGAGKSRPMVVIRFALDSRLARDDDNRKRLSRLKEGGLQALIPRREARDVASHGTGLYLANLAAAVVGWRLSIQDLDFDNCWFSFLLERVHDMKQIREAR